MGQCPACQSWNTISEQAQVSQAVGAAPGWRPASNGAATQAEPMSSDAGEVERRIETGIAELDRVFGGGIVPGSSSLLAGDPGVGKSTLLLQVAAAVARRHGNVLYATGEESTTQLKARSRRLGLDGQDVYLLSSGNVADITSNIGSLQPALVVVDSVQTAFHEGAQSASGTVTQIRECAAILAETARRADAALLLAGHVTKDGSIAGPRVLEHMVDVVLQFDGDSAGELRFLHGVKNRFGATHEVGVFAMTGEGLDPVPDPSKRFLAQRQLGVPGSAVTTVMEGSRPMNVEVQALAVPSTLAAPRRVSNGFDLQRLHLILAVLAKRLGLPVASQDVVVNVAGGMRITEPAADLAVALAVASSVMDRPLRADVAVFGEVGLGGELRGVPHLQRRVTEAARLGLTTCLVPASAAGSQKAPVGSVAMSTLAEAIGTALETAVPRARAQAGGN
jgi:DNA repair protein RadA/Sms